MNINHRLLKLEQKSNIDKEGRFLLTPELWKEAFEGKDILPKLSEKHRQALLEYRQSQECFEFRRKADMRLAEAAETMAEFENVERL